MEKIAVSKKEKFTKTVGTLIWVVGSEADDIVSVRPYGECISPHRDRPEIVFGLVRRRVVAGVFWTPCDGLEVVAVKMERVSSRVVVVHDDLYDIVLLQDEGVGVAAVDGRIVRICAG